MTASGGPGTINGMITSLLVTYLISHCVGFAGFGLMVAVWAYDRKSAQRMLSYNVFLFAFFLYLIPSNVAFFRAGYLNLAGETSKTWYFASNMVLTSLLMASYSVFFYLLPLKVGSRRPLYALIALSCVPLAFLAGGLVAGSGPSAVSLRVAFMKISVLFVSALLAGSSLYFRRNIDNADDAVTRRMMGFTALSNLVFIGPFIAQTTVNFGTGRPWAPLCVESLYYLVIHAATIGILAVRVYVSQRDEFGPENDEASDSGSEGVAAPGRIEGPALSDREWRIMELMTRGFANKQIAAELAVTEHTVRNHIYRLFKRFGVRNRVELSDLYRRTRQTPPRGD